MQILRFNPFGQIHKGLRALLYDTALLLQHTNFTIEEEIDLAVERVKLVNTLFEHHAHIEDSRIFPLIQSFAPHIVDDFEAQHQKDHELSEGLERCFALFTETNNAAQNRWAGNELLQSFNAFLAFNVEHMKAEETVINGCLWRHFTDEELLKKVQEISASIPPEQNKLFIYWMLKGMATHEIIDWYNVVKLSAPGPVFHFFCDLAEASLPEEKWNKVKDALQEGALLAE
jgi:hemerythrin-like domain-containing protein